MAQARGLNEQAAPSPPHVVIALPDTAGGMVSFASLDEARAAITDEMIAEALALAGAWSDLADRDVEGELDRLRHEAPPSLPVVL